MPEDKWEWVFIAGMLVLGAVLILLVIAFLMDHPFLSGILIGLAAGIGGTVVGYRIRRWLRTHKITAVTPPDKD